MAILAQVTLEQAAVEPACFTATLRQSVPPLRSLERLVSEVQGVREVRRVRMETTDRALQSSLVAPSSPFREVVVALAVHLSLIRREVRAVLLLS